MRKYHDNGIMHIAPKKASALEESQYADSFVCVMERWPQEGRGTYYQVPYIRNSSSIHGPNKAESLVFSAIFDVHIPSRIKKSTFDWKSTSSQFESTLTLKKCKCSLSIAKWHFSSCLLILSNNSFFKFVRQWNSATT